MLVSAREYRGDYRVHVFDVDAYGDLRIVRLLHYLQQTASDASAAVGFDSAWYARAGTVWLIHRTTIECCGTAQFDDRVAVRTWVTDFRRVRSQRAYEMRRAADGTLIARGVTDWVYTDIARGTPLQPPADLQSAFMPDGVSAQERPRRLTAVPPPTAFRTQRRVVFADLDSVGHVNNARYAAYIEQDVHDALALHQWAPPPLPGQDRLVLQSLDLEYVAQAAPGDHIDGAVWRAGDGEPDIALAHVLTGPRGATLRARSAWRWSGAQRPAALLDAMRALDA
jgi:acyl-CoA thioester hydrolase